MTLIDDRPLVLDPAAQDLLFREGRTANAFTPEPVTDEQLAAIYELTKYGPTALNAQPLRIVALRSAEAKARLLPHLAEMNRAKTESAPLTVVLGYDVDFHEQLPSVFPHAPGMKDNFADETGRHAFGRDNAHLQAGYFLLAVRAAGLAAGPMGGFDKAGLDAELFPDGRTASILVVNIGRPAENAWFARLPRLSYDEIVTAL